MPMYEYCQRFRFVADMNGDLAFTVSDVWALIQRAWLLPSNGLVAMLHENERVASFLEIDCITGQGVGGVLFSLVCWFVALVAVAGIVEGQRN